MKKVVLFALLIIVSFKTFSQNPRTLLLTYARSGPNPIYQQKLDGAASYKSVGSNSVGFRYLLQSSKVITLETGFEYNHFRYKLHHVNMPDVAIPDVTESVDLVSLPLYARLTFLNYFFVNGGVLVDAELSKTSRELASQSGVGFGIGLGAKYNYKRFNIFVNPSLEQHGLVAFKKERQGARRNIFNPGVKVGVGYSF